MKRLRRARARRRERRKLRELSKAWALIQSSVGEPDPRIAGGLLYVSNLHWPARHAIHGRVAYVVHKPLSRGRWVIRPVL